MRRMTVTKQKMTMSPPAIAVKAIVVKTTTTTTNERRVALGAVVL
jgi:hypothetical protein